MLTKSSPSQDLRQPLLSQNTDDGTRNDFYEQDHGTTRPEPSAESLLHATLYPDDVYKGTTYWADLPAKEQSTWIRHQIRAVTQRELARVWQMFKVSPLEPLKSYLRSYAVSGVGFFVEGYVLFSVGNIMPLFKSLWPECWENHVVCDGQVIKAIKYLEILGVSFLAKTICGHFADQCVVDHMWSGHRRLHRGYYRPTVGSHTRCRHHATWCYSSHSYVGLITQWLDNHVRHLDILLCYWCRWRVPNDLNNGYGRQERQG